MTRDAYIAALRAFPWATMLRHSLNPKLLAERDALQEAARVLDPGFALWNKYAPALCKLTSAAGPTPGYRCTHGRGYDCRDCYAQPGEVPYLTR